MISTNQLVHIGNSDISIKEYNGQRVVTFKDIDMVHGRPDGTARKRFSDNRNRFIDGEDYFVVSADEIRTSRMFPISDNDFTNKILLLLSILFFFTKVVIFFKNNLAC